MCLLLHTFVCYLLLQFSKYLIGTRLLKVFLKYELWALCSAIPLLNKNEARKKGTVPIIYQYPWPRKQKSLWKLLVIYFFNISPISDGDMSFWALNYNTCLQIYHLLKAIFQKYNLANPRNPKKIALFRTTFYS